MSTNYGEWTNEQLIARVTELEQQLRAANTRQSTKSASQVQKPRQPRREIDSSRYTTRYIALKIAYFGQKYNGFEHHANNTTPLPTVEEAIWKALVKTRLIFKDESNPIDWDDCQYSKSGRTDKGVSAFGQVIGIRVRSARPPDSDNNDERAPFHYIKDEHPYPRLLNRVLPNDIRVLAWCPSIPEDFSARFSCRMRKYKYFFTQPAQLPVPGVQGLARRDTGGVEHEGWLDIERMISAAQKYRGLHDFRNFCKLDPGRQITNFERRIFVSSIEKVPDSPVGLTHLSMPGATSLSLESPYNRPSMYCFNVWGSAFLYNQVRCMMGVLFLIGQGLESSSVIDELLDVSKCPGKPLYDIADDRALVLWDCIFPQENDSPEIDGLEWVYPDEQVEFKNGKQSMRNPTDGRFGVAGINDMLWSLWYEHKIDETLAVQLLDAVSQQKSLSERLTHEYREAEEESIPLASNPARVIDGSGTVIRKGQYVSLLQRPRQEAIEVLNQQWASRHEIPSGSVET